MRKAVDNHSCENFLLIKLLTFVGNLKQQKKCQVLFDDKNSISSRQ